MAKHKKKKSFFQKIASRRIILTIQLVTSVIFAFFTYSLQMLPERYFIGLVIVLVILWLLMLLWVRSGVRKKRTQNKSAPLAFSKLVSVILSIFLLLGSSYIIRGNNFIDIISNAFRQTHNISVFVLQDSKIEEIEEVKELGVSYKEESTYIRKGIVALEKDMGTSVTLSESEGYVALANALYAGDVECIIVDEAYMALLEAEHEHFEAETRKIKTYAIVEDIKNVTTNTDVTKNPFVMYITGIDTYGDVSTVSRTDVNLVVVVNPLEKQILMVSIPRDTQVTLASYKAMDKLTHSAMYGINETLLTLEDFLDVQFNYYAKTNFTGIIDIIDQLGGVEIDSPHEEFTTLHGDYVIKKGVNTMDGEKALCFVRERYALPLGDLDRGKNQQLLLKAMLEKAMSPKIITNYNSILSAIEGSFETNMPSDSIRSLIKMQLDDMTGWEIFNLQVTGTFEKTTKTYSMYGSSVDTMIADEEILDAIINVIDTMESGERIEKEDIEDIN